VSGPVPAEGFRVSAGSPPVRATTPAAASPPVRVSTPRQLLSLVPVLLGFYPGASVVVLGLSSPRGTLKVSQRCPGYDPGDPDGAARTVRDVVALLARQQCLRATAVGYGPDERVAPFIRLLREQATGHGIELIELLRAEGSRYWSYVCTDPACCPPEGSPYDDTPDPALATLLPEGVPAVLPSRAALAGLIAPSGGEEAASTRGATRRAGQRAARLTRRARQSADPVARRHPVASAGIRAVRAAVRACRQDQAVTHSCRQDRAVTHAQAGWLLVALHDPWVRDDALCRMDAAHRRAHLKLWADLTRLAGPGDVAAPATLLAFTAWQAGNGPLANVALDRALDDDPRYEMARTLRLLINHGIPPAKAGPPMTPRQVAAYFRARATGTGSPAPSARHEAGDGCLSA
jgi:hypothetical protein